MSDTRRTAWESAYDKGQNYVFYPHEEVLRFLARYVRRQTGLNSFTNVPSFAGGNNWLDLGCGIGRHVVLGHRFGFDAYGIDLSQSAIDVARQWAEENNLNDPTARIVQGDIRHMPWQDGFFSVCVSHGVLDSMPFDIARDGIKDLHRIMEPGGLFYCDLVAGAIWKKK